MSGLCERLVTVGVFYERDGTKKVDRRRCGRKLFLIGEHGKFFCSRHGFNHQGDE